MSGQVFWVRFSGSELLGHVTQNTPDDTHRNTLEVSNSARLMVWVWRFWFAGGLQRKLLHLRRCCPSIDRECVVWQLVVGWRVGRRVRRRPGPGRGHALHARLCARLPRVRVRADTSSFDCSDPSSRNLASSESGSSSSSSSPPSSSSSSASSSQSVGFFGCFGFFGSAERGPASYASALAHEAGLPFSSQARASAAWALPPAATASSRCPRCCDSRSNSGAVYEIGRRNARGCHAAGDCRRTSSASPDPRQTRYTRACFRSLRTPCTARRLHSCSATSVGARAPSTRRRSAPRMRAPKNPNPENRNRGS